MPPAVDPAGPLADAIGPWALIVFLVGAGAASFSSITGTLIAAGSMVPLAYGHETRFGDQRFRWTVNVLIALSVVLGVAPVVTDVTAVRLAILISAVNGVIGLPRTVLGLYGAVRRYFVLSRTERAIFVATVVVTFALAAVRVDSLAQTIAAWR